VFIVAKGLQALGISAVASGLYAGMAWDDMWAELYLLLGGMAVFAVGRLLERRT
jgi:hypothetical protein